MTVEASTESPADGMVPEELVLTPEDAIEFAKSAHRTGRRDVARRVYEELLAHMPNHPAVLHYFGILSHDEGQHAEGLAMIERSITNEPDNSSFWNNYGRVLMGADRLNDAIDAFKHSIELNEANAEAFSNLGNLQTKRQNFDIAEACYMKAIDINPAFFEAYTNLAGLRIAEGRMQDASQLLWKAAVVEPGNIASRRILAYCYAHMGETDKARDIYAEWLAEEPGNPVAAHHLAAIATGPPPSRASDDYVRSLFDSFAATFDRKLATLQYNGPDLLEHEVHAANPAGKLLTIIDAGCGTGLCGHFLRRHASTLIGVDLSPLMVEKAKERAVYDELITGELTAFFETYPQKADMIMLGDTLCYFGDLVAVMAGAAQRLNMGGHLIFTVECNAADDRDYALFPHGRYGHGETYVRSVLGRQHFAISNFQKVVLRTEALLPVEGYLVRAVIARNSALT